jgi:uncharacterized membrane protein YhaH (DUF805 family)
MDGHSAHNSVSLMRSVDERQYGLPTPPSEKHRASHFCMEPRHQMTWIHLFGNLNGRIGRKTFWIASSIIIVVELATATVATAIGQKFWNEATGHTAADIVMFLFLFPQFLVAVKRGHDRNISTWVVSAWLVLLATTDALDFFGWLPSRIDLNVFSVANLLVFSYTVIAGIVSLALLIELCFRRGTKGANRYGPDPLAIA